MHKVFISYHHANDQWAKEELSRWGLDNVGFVDSSVQLGDIDDSLSSEAIRRIIRDNHLRDSTVTVLLAGTETRFRKHVDWELKSSMINGSVNKRSGLLVINLPSTGCTNFRAAHDNEKPLLYPECKSWTSIKNRAVLEDRYSHLPARVIDNLMQPNVRISITSWDHLVANPSALPILIDNAHNARIHNEYDLSRKMRRANHNPNSQSPMRI